MITKTEKKKIKEILGWRYARLVQEFLTKNEYYNSKGAPYPTAMIVNVMNGNQNERIEDAIYELVALKKAKLAARKELLNSDA